MKIVSYFATAIVASALAGIPALAQNTPGQEQQPSQSQADQMPSQPSQQAQAFTGKIVKTSDGMTLQDQATNTSYKLDDQKQAKKFAGKNVKITGTLDSATNTIHVTDIQLMTTY